jgi:hypothetical protein
MLGDSDMTEAAAHLALHDDRETVIHDAVVTARRAIGADSAMAAVANGADRYEMRLFDGVREMFIRPGRRERPTVALTQRRARGPGGSSPRAARTA